MNNILNYFLESGFALGAFSLFFLFALKQEKSFTFNRFYLLGSVAVSLIIPLLAFQFKAVPSSLVAGTIFLDPVTLGTANTTNFNLLSFWPWAYGLIAGFFLIKLIITTSTLIIKRNHSRRLNGIRLCESNHSSEAYTFWDTVFIGSQLNEKEQNIILTHEEVHAREWHTLDILFIEIVTAIFWVNPFLYIIKKLVRTNHEYLADAKALKQSDKETYIQTLASHTVKAQGYQLTHAFHTSSALKRIKMINKQNNQIMKIKQITPFILGLVLVVVFGCEDASEQLSGMSDEQAASAIAQVQTTKVKVAEGIEGVYDMVEVQPGPEGGMTEFYQWVAETMKYPNQARKIGVEGRVFVQFIVDEIGNITEVKSIKGIGAGCDAEAVRVLKESPKWTPGQVDGKPVKVRMVMPVSFKLRG